MGDTPHPGLPEHHLPALRRSLAAASSVSGAARAVVEHLAAVPGLMPSLYLERDGRLRCQAVRGYWQIRDGLPPTAGVIGRTFRTGEPAVELDVAGAADYLEAAVEVAAEICVPIRAGGILVGALNVESPQQLPASLVVELEACAAAFAERLDVLGGPPPASAAQRLLAHATRLGALRGAREIEREVIAAARDVLGMDSAMLLRRDPFGRLAPTEAVGPLAAALRGASNAAIAALDHFVKGGTSSYTVGETDGGVPDGIRALRAAGVQAIVALQVGGEDDPRGILVAADAGAKVPATDEVELLELLVTHAASCLRTAEAVAELRERAARDPLTGLGHHGTFHDALRAGRLHSEIAVLLVDVDGFKAINDARGHQAGDRVLVEVAAALSGALRRGDELFRIGGDEFAALLHITGEAEALDAGRRLRAAAAQTGSVTVSVGVAVPGEQESDAALLARADRALYTVKAAGKDGVELATGR
jgi:diguanylate cyclase (GGDEF)-like protein